MTVRIYLGDCRTRLRDLAAESVDCCVTSPPYFGLRDYGTATWDGGSAGCDHIAPLPFGSADSIEKKQHQRHPQFRTECKKCGARRVDQQIGLEPNIPEFKAAMLEVFREVHRVLKPTGTLFLNLGDSYAGARSGPDVGSTLGGSRHSQNASKEAKRAMTASARRDETPVPRSDLRQPGLKPKDLMGIPWEIAFALRADGWWLRQEIIWHKPNPIPESVGDRCTKAHEHLFLLTKSPTYYFDTEAIAEEASQNTHARKSMRPGSTPRPSPKSAEAGFGTKNNSSFNDAVAEVVERRNKRSVWTVGSEPFDGVFCTACRSYFQGPTTKKLPTVTVDGKRRRICTCGESEAWVAHFAMFPTKLIEPCILAGCPEGGTVLDPFGGAGTTALVADRLGRDAILIELNADYAEMATHRLRRDAQMFFKLEVIP